MGTCRPRFAALLAVLAALAFASPVLAEGNPDTAAIQVALRARGLYTGTVDGQKGPATTHAIKRLQLRAGLPADGVAGPATRKVLGRYGRHVLGSRPLKPGLAGWDVAALQFLLAWHGFPSSTFDGGLGDHTERALKRFQRWAGLRPDGVGGASTIAALRRAPASSPISLAWPLQGPIGDPFGPRGNRFHAGIDIPAGSGAPVSAAATGRVSFVGNAGPDWGNLVVLNNADHVQTLYAHLSAISVRKGQTVSTGARVGLVGMTGDATGPHLHFEVRLRGASIDPLPALP
jgi:murein DD-endopeptidase MepM/ murein hydrolase activator NlpD